MKGDPDREVAIFSAALEVSPPERGALLERLCGRDDLLRHKVEALLRAHDRLGSFLEGPPPGESVD